MGRVRKVLKAVGDILLIIGGFIILWFIALFVIILFTWWIAYIPVVDKDFYYSVVNIIAMIFAGGVVLDAICSEFISDWLKKRKEARERQAQVKQIQNLGRVSEVPLDFESFAERLGKKRRGKLKFIFRRGS